MHKALNAYEQNAKVTQSPRELEASLLLKAASQLQYIADNWRENWGKENNEFLAALYYNRRLWSVLLGSIAGQENPLPIEIKNNVASLGAFVLRHTITVQAYPSPEKLKVLVTINKELAAGLNAAQAK